MDDERRSSEPRRAIAATRAAFTDAVRHGDITAAAGVYSSAARLVAPSTELVEGRDAIAAFWQAGVDAGVVDVELQEATVESDGRFAYELGRYVLHVRPAADELVVDRGRYVLVLAREGDGAWRRVVEMFSPESVPRSVSPSPSR